MPILEMATEIGKSCKRLLGIQYEQPNIPSVSACCITIIIYIANEMPTSPMNVKYMRNKGQNNYEHKRWKFMWEI